MKKPIISIIIPTHNSESYLDVTLKAIVSQNCSRNVYEIILSDNKSTDNTQLVSKKYGAQFVSVSGKPPQVCRQRNIGTKFAHGKYLLFLDHDVEVGKGLFKIFLNRIKNAENQIDAWYIPYKNRTSSRLLTLIRNLEDEFYLDSIIAAARLVKKEFAIKNGVRFDTNLSSGPADWDYNLQLMLKGARFGTLSVPVFHHEERLSFWRYTIKKKNYISGNNIYINKWRKLNPEAYKNIVQKQFDPIYRLVTIFVENNKFVKLIPKFPIYILFLFTKILMGIVYYYHTKKQSL